MNSDPAAELSMELEHLPQLRAFMMKGRTWYYFELLTGKAAAHTAAAPRADNGDQYFFVSLRYLCKDGGSAPTAMKNIAMFALFGLVNKISSEAEGRPYFMREGYRAHAEDTGRHGVTWYRIPAYTPDLLQEAEGLAETWNASGLSRKSICKTTLIRLYGRQLAERAYGENRVGASAHLQETQRRLEAEARSSIERQGYWYPPRNSRAWHTLRPFLLQKYGWQYVRPTTAEAARYGLTGGRFIVTARPPYRQ